MSSLVVLVGWLGCQEKSLKHYVRVYNSLGFDAVTFFPSTFSIVNATLSSPDKNEKKIRISYPSPDDRRRLLNNNEKNLDTIQDMAWKVLIDIHNRRAEMFIFHVFSNGGCFLWESLCRILHLSKNDKKGCDPKLAKILDKLSSECRGVVFDSCPCWFGSTRISKLSQALQYCPKAERQRILSAFGERIFAVDDKILNRNLEYFHNLSTSPFDIPQLYIYSRNDQLCNCEHITKLIKCRRKIQKQPIHSFCFDDSKHCSHLMEHRKDYEKLLKNFIQLIEVFVESRL